MVTGLSELEPYKEKLEKWCEDCCGTVHKFQGKESDEVIFLLGCDEKAKGVVRWVKPNVVNVAVTRAKYRLYIISEYGAWKQSKIFRITKSIMEREG